MPVRQKSMSGEFFRTVALLFVAAAVLFYSSDDKLSLNSGEFYLQDSSNIYTRTDINHAGHVYPYMASVVSLGCLLMVVMLIICSGGQLG